MSGHSNNNTTSYQRSHSNNKVLIQMQRIYTFVTTAMTHAWEKGRADKNFIPKPHPFIHYNMERWASTHQVTTEQKGEMYLIKEKGTALVFTHPFFSVSHHIILAACAKGWNPAFHDVLVKINFCIFSPPTCHEIRTFFIAIISHKKKTFFPPWWSYDGMLCSIRVWHPWKHGFGSQTRSKRMGKEEE